MRTERAVVVTGPLRAMPVLAVGGASQAGPMLGDVRGPVATGLSTAVIPAVPWPGEETPDDTAAALAALFQENDA